ncbi:MAG: L,D-transpeptidase family protein [Akkermansiaceae bacterium]|jgi:hypothetical protein|nr:L,D-transpeptidase family protein [Akkermansiaceae bacterium]
MRLLLFLIPLILVSCGASESNKPGYRVKWMKYRATSEKETKIQISLWDQKAWLLNGRGAAVLETDVATGVPGKETPQGIFEVLERIESKRSNRYGKYVNEATGKVVVEKSWEHSGEVPEGCVYEGIAMPYWMRLTWDGVGMHVGKFKKRTRSSFGCIRAYQKAQPLIYRKTRIGTPVEIVPQSLQEQLGL